MRVAQALAPEPGLIEATQNKSSYQSIILYYSRKGRSVLYENMYDIHTVICENLFSFILISPHPPCISARSYDMY